MRSSQRTVRDLRGANRQAVLQHIYFAGFSTRMEVSQRTGLSPATVTNVVAEMIEEGILIESGVEESDGGRPRVIIEINPDYGTLVGIEVGEAHIQIEVFDLTLRNLGMTRYWLTEGESQPERLVNLIAEKTNTLLADLGIAHDKVLSVGIGVPGVVERLGRVSIFAPDWQWHNVPLLSMLGARLDMPIYLDNRVKAMALVETWFGAGCGADDLAIVTIGIGVGAAIVTQGEIYRGATNSAGELGHIPIELNGRSCYCGNHGCLEAYVGAPALVQRLRELDPDSSLLDGPVTTVTAIVDAARRGDPIAVQIMSETACYLGAGIASLINIFNPQRVIVGGWAGLAIGEYIWPELVEHVKRYALKRPFEVTRLVLSQLGQDAISMGAACLGLGDFLGSNMWQGPHAMPIGARPAVVWRR